MMDTYATPIEAVILYRAMPGLAADSLVGHLTTQAAPRLDALKPVKTTDNALILSDGHNIIAIEHRPEPRLAHKFSGIGSKHSAFHIIRDHSAHIVIRIAPIVMNGTKPDQSHCLQQLQLCADLCQLLMNMTEPMAIHWQQSAQLLLPDQFDTLRASAFGLFLNIQSQSAPIGPEGQIRYAYHVEGAQQLLGMQLRIGPSTWTADLLSGPVQGFVETCLRQQKQPVHQTTFITKSGMEFTVTHTSSRQDETATLELTPSVTPAKVSVERRRAETEQVNKPAQQTHGRRRIARQDERDLRHAYRGQKAPQPRKVMVTSSPVNRNWAPMTRFVGSLAFMAALGFAAALGVGVNVYGTDGLSERAQAMWDKTGFSAPVGE